MKYNIAEIFGPTIQGEGTHAGRKVGFIRFADCNLSCSFCDTDHRSQMQLTASEIVEKLPKNIKRVVITGGEPLLQVDQNLLDALKDYETHLETNGTIALGDLKFHHVTVSPKLSPSETHIEYADDLKLLYPIYDPSDWPHFKAKNKYLQPIDLNGEMKIKETLERIYLESDWDLSVQLHKFIGVE
ncbi:MAG: 7-carboxy-7-deazaguanine synthase QueE [Bacteriovoracaceae bacterium]|nr:7-carboxy-7-deazaguanine synthase QueE [Bacteriovoracaceae bacterium]